MAPVPFGCLNLNFAEDSAELSCRDATRQHKPPTKKPNNQNLIVELK